MKGRREGERVEWRECGRCRWVVLLHCWIQSKQRVQPAELSEEGRFELGPLRVRNPNLNTLA